MKVTFSARHFDATAKLQDFAKKELSNLEKYFDNTNNAEIILEENGNLKIAYVRINAYGKVFTAQAEGSDFYKVIPKSVEKLQKQLKSTKSKVTNR